MIRTIGASIGVTVCFFYLGCGSIQVANASDGTNSAPLTIATKLLPSAIAGTPYVVVLDASGGTPGYTWSITAGKLPLGVSLIPTSGIISGTPTVSGNFSVSLTLSDASNPSEKRTSTVTIAVASPALTIVPAVLPSATDGTPYSQTLRATGGQPSYTWSITSGTLPAGLTLGSSSGVISGTPTGGGTSGFGVSVRDNERPAQSQSSAMSIFVIPAALKIMTSALPSAVDGASYSQSLRASGGTPGYKWAVVSGNMPAGLTLAPATGAITGTPTSSGAASFMASVSDSGNPAQAISAPITIVVAPARLTIAAPALPSVIVGTSYSQSIQVTGGKAPYLWSIISGQLPVGLALTSSTGAITGIPTVSGTATFTATVSDSSNPKQSASSTMALVVSPTVLTIKPAVLPAVRVGSAYSQALQASGGTTPYKWSIASGSLPAGLNLSSSTGTISGTPTSSGTATFTAAVIDSGNPAQSASSTATVLVTPTPLIITSSALPSDTAGAGYSQTLQAIGGSAPYTWAITSGKLPTGLTLTPSTGTISGTPTASGPFTFTATVTDASNPAQEASATTDITVTSTALTITTHSLAPITLGIVYSQILTATGGVAPYTWSITSGQLPGGLSIWPSTGIIAGTATSGGSSSFTVSVSDSSSPAQTNSSGFSIVGITTPLSITSSSLSTGVDGTSYSQILQASGGTPAYTWSITSGSLPAGLTLAATSGAISGTPTSSGTSTFTATVTDNESPAQTQSAATSITVTAAAPAVAGPGTTWFIRTDGGTRYSAGVPTGQCDGQADAAYSGTGTNQHCAFNDLRYMWATGEFGNSAWVMAGGDTLVIGGCHAAPDQVNPSNPNCRVGWDTPTGSGSLGLCNGVTAFWGCSMPPPPSGTTSQHTRILGSCAYGTYTCNPVIAYPYTSNNLTQIYGGFAAFGVMYLYGSQYLDIEGLEITTHNGRCSQVGAPAYPRGCNASSPLDDFSKWGILTDNKTSNLTLQDVYIHGLTTEGMGGPIGGPVTLNRVSIDFNAFAGWNFDDGNSTPDAPGSTITQSYVTMVGNGCLEQYPITNVQFPALGCWDSNDAGFGDSWSGQNTTLASFTCDHCSILYNVKDGGMGPHTIIHNISLTNSEWIGNMGQAEKWGQDANATFLFQNNLIVGNCLRMSQQLPGAAQNFNITTGLGGSYLSNYCRASGSLFAYFTGAGSTVNITDNSIVTYQPTIFDLSCITLGACGSTPYNFTNNLILGYTTSLSVYPDSGQAPGLYYAETAPLDLVGSHNIEYGVRNGDTCGSNGNICSDPILVNEPAQGSYPAESVMDNFNFHLTSGSSAIGAGITIPGLTTDYFGTTRPTPPTIGAVQP